MATVEFNLADGVPYMYRDTNVPTVNTMTMIVTFKVMSYEDFFAVLSLRSSGGNATEIWGDASGDVNVELDFGGAQTIFSGSESGWLQVAMSTEESGGVTLSRVRYREFGGASSNGSTDTEVVAAFDRIRVASNDSFPNDMEGTLRFAGIKIYNRTLTTGQIDAEFDQRTPASTTNLVFYNACDSADDIEVDGSPVAENMTLSGTPTLITTDDPWASSDVTVGLTGSAITSAAGTMVPTHSTPLTGSAITSAHGTLIPGSSIPLIGSGIASGQGNIAVDGDRIISLVGESMTASAGTMVPGIGPPLTGSGITSGQGSVTYSASRSLTGSAITSSVGTITTERTVPLVGSAITSGQGSISPLSYSFTCSANGRVLLRNGTPFFIVGQSLWAASAKLNTTTATSLKNTISGQGFNSLLMELWSNNQAVNYGPANVNGTLPFTGNASGGAYTGAEGTADFATPNNTYWRHTQDVVNVFTDAGLMVLLFPMPWGFLGAHQGIYEDIVNAVNTTVVHEAFAAYLARGSGGTFTGFADNENVIWMIGSDYGSNNATDPSATALARQLAFMQALKANGCNQLMAFNGQAPMLGTDETTFENECTIQSDYNYGGVPPTTTSSESQLRTYQNARRAYNYTPVHANQSQGGTGIPTALPAFLMETAYDNSSFVPGDPPDLRKAQYWAWLSGDTNGYFYGHEDVYHLNTGYLDHLADTSALDAGRIATLVGSLNTAVNLLVPSELGGMAKLIGGSRGSQTGSPTNYISAAVSSDGSLLIAYAPYDGTTDPQTFTVNLTNMAAASRLRWWDPTNGTFETEANGVSNAETAFSVTTPGANSAGQNDWLLIADTGETAVALTGSAITSSAGTIVPNRTVAIAGAGFTSSAGTMSPNLTIALTGAQITSGQGTISIGNDVSISLTGESMTASAGTLIPGIAPALSGERALFSAGTITATGGTEVDPVVPGPESIINQFRANIDAITASPTPRFLEGGYRYLLEKEPGGAADRMYTVDVSQLLTGRDAFGSGIVIRRAIFSVHVAYPLLGGKTGNRLKVMQQAEEDSIRIADVCSNPENYDSEHTGLRIVTFESTTLIHDEDRRQIWETRFICEWQAEFNGEAAS